MEQKEKLEKEIAHIVSCEEELTKMRTCDKLEMEKLYGEEY